MTDEIDDDEIERIQRHQRDVERREGIYDAIEIVGRVTGFFLKWSFISVAFVFAVWLALQVLGE